MPLYPKLRARLLAFPKHRKQKCPTLNLSSINKLLSFSHCMHIRVHVSHVLALLEALGHALVHESEEADGAGADAHAVDEAAGEERAEDGAEVGVGDL
jgi:hypothetical protein